MKKVHDLTTVQARTGHLEDPNRPFDIAKLIKPEADGRTASRFLRPRYLASVTSGFASFGQIRLKNLPLRVGFQLVDQFLTGVAASVGRQKVLQFVEL